MKTTCKPCSGRGWFARRLATSPGARGYAKKVKCQHCGGRGWRKKEKTKT